MTTIEGKHIPKFLISDVYNNVDDLDTSRGSFVSFGGKNKTIRIVCNIVVEDEGRTCGHCLKQIFDLNDSVTVGDFKYHVYCIYCTKCNKNLDPSICIIKNTKAYCAECEVIFILQLKNNNSLGK